MNATGIRRNASLMLLTTGLLIGGCSTQDQARNALRQGDAVRAVTLYEQALASKPEDPRLSTELTQARHSAGQKYADQAAAALNAARYAQAVQAAQQAVQYDARYRELETQARHAHAQRLLSQSATALKAASFDEARSLAEQAAIVSPDLNEPHTLRYEVDHAQAQSLRTEALALTEAGRFDRAARLAERVAALTPNDPDLAALPTVVSQLEREASFDGLAPDVATALASGKLATADQLVADLTALQVRSDELALIRQAVQQHHDEVNQLLDTARRHAADESFDEALAAYGSVEALVTDRPHLIEERKGVQARKRFATLLADARAAAEQGDDMTAIRAYEAALNLDGNATVMGELQSVRARFARRGLARAQEEGDDFNTLRYFQDLLRAAPNDPLAADYDSARHRDQPGHPGPRPAVARVGLAAGGDQPSRSDAGPGER
jgi:tetratricopeptide (TPR) repeat protein